MEAVRRGQNAPAAGSGATGLNGRFNGFRAAIGKRDVLQAGRSDRNQTARRLSCRLEEGRLHKARLLELAHGLDSLPDGWMVVAKRDGAVLGNKVQVALPLLVVEIAPLATREVFVEIERC